MCCSTMHRPLFCNFLIGCFLASLLLSCEQRKQPATFYPVDSLIAGQAAYLAQVQAGLLKEALLSGSADTVSYTPADASAWMNELGVFNRLDVINKPVNKGSYLVDDGLFDPGSNLTVKAFTSLKKLPVVYLKIYYQGTIDKPRKIEALYDDTNALYESARLLSMHFEQVENTTVLTRYSIRGGQEMVFGDTVAFYISGRVLID